LTEGMGSIILYAASQSKELPWNKPCRHPENLGAVRGGRNPREAVEEAA
jgi:hypothetical protein